MPFINELIKKNSLNEQVLIKKIRKEDYVFPKIPVFFNLLKQHIIRSNIRKFPSPNAAVFAAYPSIDKPVILCQLNQAQTLGYSEAFLLPKPKGVSRVVKSIISKLAGISYEFDSFVIIDSIHLKHSLKCDAVEQFIGAKPSFIELCTSNPTLLVFDEEQIKPPVVIRNQPLSRYKQVALCKQLCKLNPELFPDPLLVEKTMTHLICIEELVIGKPWFQLKESLDSKSVKERAIIALKNFEETVKKMPDWNESINLYEKGKKLSYAISSIIELESGYWKKINSELNKVKEFDNIQVPHQHGDFSINNLIYTAENCKIIDLEDFGELTLPLFDCISLAISFTDSYLSDMTVNNVISELNLILDDLNKNYSEQFKRYSLILFLLSRLGQWSDNPNRKPFSKKLGLLLVELLDT